MDPKAEKAKQEAAAKAEAEQKAKDEAAAKAEADQKAKDEAATKAAAEKAAAAERANAEAAARAAAELKGPKALQEIRYSGKTYAPGENLPADIDEEILDQLDEMDAI
ncbi:hypothetical protein [Shinella sp.]|uniref:hypothetical protein n=1 Tax=Shinella sp. TaxID=1870904 RepID=UPI0039E3E877